MKQRYDWLPCIATAVLGAVSLMVYPYTVEQVEPIVYVQVTACALIPTALLLLGRLGKRPFPVYLNTMAAVQVVLASFLGSALGFYKQIAWWDLLMHAAFGFLGAAVVYRLLRRGEVALGLPLLCLTVFLSVMGLAALWEAFEYVADLLFHGDAQRVLAALEADVSPVRDTMTDILITMVGIVLYGAGALLLRRYTIKDLSR